MKSPPDAGHTLKENAKNIAADNVKNTLFTFSPS
jgi:hypothetical protein